MIDLLAELTLEDLYGDQHDLAECLGMEMYIKLVRTFSGSPINVPMPYTIVYDICSYKSTNR